MKPSHKMSLVATITIALVFSFIAGIAGLVLWFSGASGVPGIALSLILSFGIISFQWYFSPRIIKAIYRLKPVEKSSEIYKIVEKLSKKAGLKTPQVWFMDNESPNAFAFGRSRSNANVCVTKGLLGILGKDELEAVIAHELGHVNHRDMVIMSLASIIPLMFYYIAITFQPRGRRDSGYGVLIFVGAMMARFVGQLIVLWLSRVREYSADAFSAYQTSPENMMRALAKIGYGLNVQGVSKKDKGLSAFYVAEPEGSEEIRRVARLAGLDEKEFQKAVKKEKKFSFKELFMTHPLMHKRIINLKKNSFN